MYYFCPSFFHPRFLYDTASQHRMLGIGIKSQLYTRKRRVGTCGEIGMFSQPRGLFVGCFPLFSASDVTIGYLQWLELPHSCSTPVPTPQNRIAQLLSHAGLGAPDGVLVHRLRRADHVAERRLCLDLSCFKLQPQWWRFPAAPRSSWSLQINRILMYTHIHKVFKSLSWENLSCVLRN